MRFADIDFIAALEDILYTKFPLCDKKIISYHKVFVIDVSYTVIQSKDNCVQIMMSFYPS